MTMPFGKVESNPYNADLLWEQIPKEERLPVFIRRVRQPMQRLCVRVDARLLPELIRYAWGVTAGRPKVHTHVYIPGTGSRILFLHRLVAAYALAKEYGLGDMAAPGTPTGLGMSIIAYWTLTEEIGFTQQIGDPWDYRQDWIFWRMRGADDTKIQMELDAIRTRQAGLRANMRHNKHQAAAELQRSKEILQGESNAGPETDPTGMGDWLPAEVQKELKAKSAEGLRTFTDAANDLLSEIGLPTIPDTAPQAPASDSGSAPDQERTES